MFEEEDINRKNTEADAAAFKIRGDLASLDGHLNKLNILRRQALNDLPDLKDAERFSHIGKLHIIPWPCKVVNFRMALSPIKEGTRQSLKQCMCQSNTGPGYGEKQRPRTAEIGIFTVKVGQKEVYHSGDIVFYLVALALILVVGCFYCLYKNWWPRVGVTAMRQMGQGLDPTEIEMICVSAYMEGDEETLLDEGEREHKECTICLSELEQGQPTSKLSCGHGFHTSCIKRWLGLRAVWPNCRRHIHGPSF